MKKRLPDFRVVVNELSKRRGAEVTVFADFCRMAACALAVQTREDEYFEVIKGYSKEELNLFAQALASLVTEMEANPFEDVLGAYYLEVASKSTKDLRGEFYTPQAISRLMARMSFEPEQIIAANRPISVLEPASGAGGMILAMAELLTPQHVSLMRVTCWDINPMAADMCFINTTLWGIPTRMILGNTLTMEITKQWTNVHWRLVGEDLRLRFEELLAPPEPEVKLPVEREPLIHEARAQLDFEF